MPAATDRRSDALASLPRPDRHVPKGAPVRPSKVSRRRAYVLIAVHVVIALHIWHWLATGSSLTPVEPSEAMQTVEVGRINAGFVLFVVLIGSTLVFGRFFCGWACHVVALQDLSAWLLGKVGCKPRPVRSRLLVFAPWVVAFFMFGWPIVQQWLGERQLPRPADWQWQLMTDDLWQTFPGPIMAVGTFVVVGFLIVWWLGAKGFCTYGCPYGAFFAVADRFAPVRIKVTDACDACGHCTNVCTSNVRVHEEVARHKQIVDPACMKCLDCVSVCPKEALYVGLAAPKPFVLSQQRIKQRGDFTWPEELLLGVVALVAAQFTFRGAWFGESVPFLMAVGLGVITAVLTLLLLRLVVRKDVTFQYTALRANGRFSRPGWSALVLVAGWLVFALHTFSVQRRHAELVTEVHALTSAATPAEVAAVLAHADGDVAWQLVRDPRTLELRGLLHRRMGQHVQAEADLLASHNARGYLEHVQASLSLAGYCMDPARGRHDLAEPLVRGVLARYPEQPVALQMLQALENRRR